MNMKKIHGTAAAMAATVLLSSPIHAQDVPFGVAGVKIPVSDIDRAKAFYVRYAGLREGRFYAPYEFAMLPAQGVGASLVLYNINAAPKTDQPGRGLVLIRVPDVTVVADRLLSDKMPGVGKVIDAGVARIMVAHDPDGNAIEFLQMKP